MAAATLTLDQFERHLAQALREASDPAAVKRALSAASLVAVADVKGHIAKGTTPDGRKWPALKHRRPAGGNKPLRHTGALMASIRAKADAHGLTVGTAHPGAGLLHAGGTVRPKKGKWLAIPLTVEAARVGSPRKFRGKLFAVIGQRGGVLIHRAGGRETAHFALVKSVTIPSREFLGLSEAAHQRIAEILLDAATKPLTR